MSIPPLSDVCSKYGAPMGRPNILSAIFTPYKFVLQRLAFIDGAYDEGGAYWGSPENVWRAVTPEAQQPWRSNWDGTPQDDARHLEVFVRADTYAQACLEVQAVVPHAEFYPEQPFLPAVARAVADVYHHGGCPGRMVNMIEILESLDEFTVAYIEAALWTEEEMLESELTTAEARSREDAPFTLADFSVELLQQMVKDCRTFQEYNDLTNYPAKNAGHDFWMTRCHSGCGFWEVDFGTEEQCEKLTEAAHAYGEVHLYLGDDNFIYA